MPDDTLEAVVLNGYCLLRIRCPRCGQLTKARGAPLRFCYLGDDGKERTAKGIMFARIDPSHYAVCEGLDGS